MTRRAKRPLNPAAKKAANEAYYANNPEKVKEDGTRVPIGNSSKETADRTEWMDHYVAAGGEIEGDPADSPNVGEVVQPCPNCWIKFQFLTKQGDLPLARVQAEITDPNGLKRTLNSNAQGLITIQPAVPGNYELRTDLADYTLSQVFHVTDQSAASVPVTASQAPPPKEDPPHVKDGKVRGDKTASDPALDTRRANAIPWSPKAFAEIKKHKVQNGDNLKKLAKSIGWTWQKLAQFNFGTKRPREINDQLRDLIGCTRRDKSGLNYIFRSKDHPGLMYLPKELHAKNLASNQVHLFRSEAVERPVKLEVQTVDELGVKAANISLTLVKVDGQKHSIKTNKEGYWSDTLVLKGPVDVYYADGKRARFYTGSYQGTDQKTEDKVGVESDPFAQLDPLLARRAISNVVVPGLVSKETLQRRDALLRRYGRTPKDRDLAGKVAQRTGSPKDESGGGSGSGKSTAPPVARSQFRAVDNLFMIGMDEKSEASKVTKFILGLDQWLRDRHGTTVSTSRGYYVMLVIAHQLMVLVPKGKDSYTPKGTFDVTSQIYYGEMAMADGTKTRGRNRYGAYSLQEVGGETAVFTSLGPGSVVMGLFDADPDIDPVWEACKSKADAEKLRVLIEKLAPKAPILYLYPPSGDARAVAAFWGGCGLLEDYPASGSVRDRVHNRNIKVVRAVRTAYRGYLTGYIDKVKKTKDARKLKALGPPLNRYVFPVPAGDPTTKELLDIYSSTGPGSFQAWLAITEQLAKFENRHTAGSLFFRGKFELSNNVNLPIGGGGGKISWNMDIGSDGILTKTERTAEVAVGPDGVPIPGWLKATGTAQVKREVNTETGETKDTLALGISRGGKKYGFEASSDGNVKFMGPYGAFSEWNSRTAEGGFGFCLSMQDLLERRAGQQEKAARQGYNLPTNTLDRINGAVGKSIPNATICFGIGFVLIREDQLLSYLVRAPGFFERREPADWIVCHWNSLWSTEQYQLKAIGWDEKTWDRKWPNDFPKPTRLDYSKLSAAHKIAAVKLALNQLNWLPMWNGQFAMAKSRKKMFSSGK